MENGRESEEGVLHLETRVFPLWDVKRSDSGTPCEAEYKGTCFLIRMGQQHVFVTAKHLLFDQPDKYDLMLGYNTPEGESSLIKVRAGYTNHVSQDVSFFLPTAEMKSEYDHLLCPMEWLRHRLPIGQGVLAYGFPGRAQNGQAHDLPMLEVRRGRYEGKVVGIEEDHPFARTGRVYYLGFHAPPGLSGAPVMVVHDNTLAVAGYILGEQTTDGRPVAACTDNTPFIEIERLLADISRKLANDSDQKR